MPLLIWPENAITRSVAPASTNQVLTSWLLTTSPFSWASSRRFWLGSSDFSESSSAIFPQRSGLGSDRGEPGERGFDLAEKHVHQGAQHQQKDHQAEQDREREADEEHLHLRHQPRQDAEPEIEQEPEHHERRRELDADAERGRHGAGGERRDIAQERNLPGREQRIAVVEGRDHQMMEIGGE